MCQPVPFSEVDDLLVLSFCLSLSTYAADRLEFALSAFHYSKGNDQPDIGIGDIIKSTC